MSIPLNHVMDRATLFMLLVHVSAALGPRHMLRKNSTYSSSREAWG